MKQAQAGSPEQNLDKKDNEIENLYQIHKKELQQLQNKRYKLVSPFKSQTVHTLT